MTLLALASTGTQLCIPVLGYCRQCSGTAQVLVLAVLDCRYCVYVNLLVVVVVGVLGCIISHMYTPHFNHDMPNYLR